MFFAVNRSASVVNIATKRVVCALLIYCISICIGTFDAMARTRPQKMPSEQISSTANPDQLLIEVYKSLAENKLQNAQVKIDELIDAYPHFQLAHLIRGDLLLMHTRPVASFGAGEMFRVKN
jgi:hypothetical protein